MAGQTTVLTIDIGSDVVKMAEFGYGDGVLVLNKFVFEPLAQGDDDPIVAFGRVFQFMLQTNNFSAQKARVAISGQAAFSRLSKLPELSGDDEMISKIIEFEAKQTVPYAMEEIIWDYQLIKHSIPPVTELDEPHDEYEALFVAAKKDIIRGYTDVIMENGIEVISVNIAPVAMSNAFYACVKREEDSCDMVLDIGGQSSSLVICEGNRVFVRTIPIAGDAITQQISKEFAIAFPEAEDMKIKHGFVALGGAYEDPESEVAATISKIARNVMTRLHGEISRSINVWRSQHNGSKPNSLYLCGGGSLIQYIVEFFKEKLNINVDYLNVFSVMSIGPEVDREALLDVAPMFAELAGMGIRSAAEVPVDINLVPDTIKVQADIQSKKIFFYACCVTFVISLLVFYAGVQKNLQFDQNRVTGIEGAVISAEMLASKISDINMNVNVQRSEYDSLRKVVSDRTVWVNILNEIQKSVPPNVWFVEISGVSDYKADIAASEGNSKSSNNTSTGNAGADNVFAGAPPPPVNGGAPGPGAPVMSAQNQLANTTARVINHIKLRGYVLNLEDGVILNDVFRNRIEKNSKLFNVSDKNEGFVFKQKNYVNTNDSNEEHNNITEVTIYIKLANPVML